MIRKLFTSGVVLAATSSSAFASTICQNPANETKFPEYWANNCAHGVPELSPMAAAAALAALAAIVALVWERRRAAA